VSDWNVTRASVGYALFFALFAGFAASMVVGSATDSDSLAILGGGAIALLVFVTVFVGAAYGENDVA